MTIPAGDPVVDSRPYTYSFTVSRDALDVMLAMRNHCDKLGMYFGPTSQAYVNAVASCNKVMVTVFGSPWTEETRVHKDGPLSMLVTGGITMGVIFHMTRRQCRRDGCAAVINDDGTAWTYSTGSSMCDDHMLTYPLDAPAPGTWSTHT